MTDSCRHVCGGNYPIAVPRRSRPIRPEAGKSPCPQALERIMFRSILR